MCDTHTQKKQVYLFSSLFPSVFFILNVYSFSGCSLLGWKSFSLAAIGFLPLLTHFFFFFFFFFRVPHFLPLFDYSAVSHQSFLLSFLLIIFFSSSFFLDSICYFLNLNNNNIWSLLFTCLFWRPFYVVFFFPWIQILIHIILYFYCLSVLHFIPTSNHFWSRKENDSKALFYISTDQVKLTQGIN